jgi:hypothetical protein
MVLLYGRAGRLASKRGGFRPGQTANALGRMAAGLGSDFALPRVDRTAWLTAALALTAAAMALGAAGPPGGGATPFAHRPVYSD